MRQGEQADQTTRRLTVPMWLYTITAQSTIITVMAQWERAPLSVQPVATQYLSLAWVRIPLRTTKDKPAFNALTISRPERSGREK